MHHRLWNMSPRQGESPPSSSSESAYLLSETTLSSSQSVASDESVRHLLTNRKPRRLYVEEEAFPFSSLSSSSSTGTPARTHSLAPWLLVDIETLSFSAWCCRRGIQYLLIGCGLLFAAFLLFFLMTLPQVLFIHSRSGVGSNGVYDNTTDHAFSIQCLLLDYSIEIDTLSDDQGHVPTTPTTQQTESSPSTSNDSHVSDSYQKGRPILQVACPINNMTHGGRQIMRIGSIMWTHAVAFRSMDPKETWPITELNAWSKSHVPQGPGEYITLYYNPSYPPFLTTSIEYTLKARIGIALTTICLFFACIHASIALADLIHTRYNAAVYRRQIQCGMVV